MVQEQCTLNKLKIYTKVLDSMMKSMVQVLDILKEKNHVTILVNGKAVYLTVPVSFILEIMRHIQEGFIKEKLMI